MNTRKRRSAQAGRGALGSLGRPPVARQEDRQRFWAAIAAGGSSEEAAVSAGVSPAVGVRWFRNAGGMPPSHLSPSVKPLSGRYPSFTIRTASSLNSGVNGLRFLSMDHLLPRCYTQVHLAVHRSGGVPTYGWITPEGDKVETHVLQVVLRCWTVWPMLSLKSSTRSSRAVACAISGASSAASPMPIEPASLRQPIPAPADPPKAGTEFDIPLRSG